MIASSQQVLPGAWGSALVRVEVDFQVLGRNSDSVPAYYHDGGLVARVSWGRSISLQACAVQNLGGRKQSLRGQLLTLLPGHAVSILGHL